MLLTAESTFVTFLAEAFAVFVFILCGSLPRTRQRPHSENPPSSSRESQCRESQGHTDRLNMTTDKRHGLFPACAAD